MKAFQFILLLVAILFLPGSSMASDEIEHYFTEDGFRIHVATEKYPISGLKIGEAKIYRYERLKDTVVNIPEKIRGYPIVCIGEDAFRDEYWAVNTGQGGIGKNTQIREITIPNTVRIIESSAFYGSIKLTSITLPESLEHIGYDAFYYCKSLESIKIPASVTEIMCNPFGSCTGLKTINIAKENTNFTVEDNVLYDFDKKRLISYPCNANATRFDIPATVESIDGGAFQYNRNIEELNIGSSLKNIGSFAFASCSSLRTVNIADGIQNLNYSIFYKCENLESISLPSSVKTIGSGAFSNCTSLKSISLPEHLDSISDRCFEKCTALSEMTFPSGLSYIGENAFLGCSSLKTVVFPEKMDEIDSGAFEECVSIETLQFPLELDIIRGSFMNCQSLRETNLPDIKINVIGNYAFSGCTSLNIDRLPEDLEHLGKYAFVGCPIKSLFIASKLKDIESYTIDSDVLESIYVSDENPYLTSDKGVLFTKDMRELILYPGARPDTTYTVPYSVRKIRDYAMIKAVNLKSLFLYGESLSIGYDAILCPESLYVCKKSENNYRLPSARESSFGSDFIKSNNSTLYVSPGLRNEESLESSPWCYFSRIETREFSGIADTEADNAFSVSRTDGDLHFNGLKAGESVKIYSTDGRLIMTTTEETVRLPGKGIFIIRYGSHNQKIYI